MTAAPMPQVTVLVAWQYGPLTDPNTITGYVGPDVVAANKWTVMSPCGTSPGYVSQLPAGGRGRQHELAVFEAATRRMRFDNSDGRFNPWNTASPYYAWLKPGRLMRVLAQWNLISQQFPAVNYTQIATGSVQQTSSLPAGGNNHLFFAVEEARRYSARVEATSTLAGCQVYITFTWYDAAGTPFNTDFGPATAIPTTGTVVASRTNVAPPAGAHSAKIHLTHTTAPGTGSGTTTFTNPGAWPSATLPAYAATVGSAARFTGLLHAFDPEWPDRRSFYVDAEASDLLRVLNTMSLPGSALELELQADNPTSYWPLSEGVGATVANDVEGVAPGTYTSNASLGGASILPGGGSSLNLPKVVYEDYVAYLSARPGNNFAISFAVSGITLPGASALIATPLHLSSKGAFVVGYQADGRVYLDVHQDSGVLTTLVNTVNIADGLPHWIALVRGGTSWSLIVDDVTWTFSTTATTLTAQLAVGYVRSTTAQGGQLAGVTLFPGALATARHEAHRAAFRGTAWAGDTATTRAGRILDHIGIPAALRSIDTTCVSPLAAVSDLGGSALGYLQALEKAEAGALFVDRLGKVTLLSRQTVMGRAYNTPAVTFGDGTGQAPYQPGAAMAYNDSEIVNQVTASRAGGLTVTVVDAGSRADHGARSRDITGLLVARDTEIIDRANFELATYADPRFVLRNLSIWPREATGMIETLLGLDLLQLVAVARSDIVGTVLNQASLLEGIEETFTPTDWRFAIAVSPHQAEQFWILDVSQLDVNTRLGF